MGSHVAAARRPYAVPWAIQKPKNHLAVGLTWAHKVTRTERPQDASLKLIRASYGSV